MTIRKTALVFVAAAATLSAKAASADTTWEHIGTVQTSMMPQKPLMRIKMYNTWTPQRHRLLLNYAFSPSVAETMGRGTMGRRMPMLTSLMPADVAEPRSFGSIGFVQRMDDDRVLAYESQTRMMISEPRMALMKRLRFNPWKKLAPELANEAPPELTNEQRTRLKAEIGAVTAPIRKRMAKIYFRALPGTRTYGTLIGKGYRLTQLLNVGGMRKNQSWMRVTTEWWIAPQDGSDTDIASFQAQMQRDRKALGGLTNSMWLNEYIVLSAIPSDPTLRAAWSSLQLPADAPEGAFRGTPLLVTSKVTLPPLQRAQMGDILLTLRLASRNQDTLANSVFQAPSGYKKFDIQPGLKKLDPILDGSAWISLWDSIYKKAG